MTENIYAIASGPEDNPQFHYVGKTIRAIEDYWQRVHLVNCKRGEHKALYTHMRSVGLDAFYIVLLDTTDNGLTEADYVQTLKDAGYQLLNGNKGNGKVACEAALWKREFNRINRKALKKYDDRDRYEAFLTRSQAQPSSTTTLH